MSTNRTEAELRKPAVEMALDPVVRRAATVVRENIRIASGPGVQLVPLAHHSREAKHDGAVRIARPVGVRMMSAVNRNPLARDRA